MLPCARVCLCSCLGVLLLVFFNTGISRPYPATRATLGHCVGLLLSIFVLLLSFPILLLCHFSSSAFSLTLLLLLLPLHRLLRLFLLLLLLLLLFSALLFFSPLLATATATVFSSPLSTLEVLWNEVVCACVSGRTVEVCMDGWNDGWMDGWNNGWIGFSGCRKGWMSLK